MEEYFSQCAYYIARRATLRKDIMPLRFREVQYVKYRVIIVLKCFDDGPPRRVPKLFAPACVGYDAGRRLLYGHTLGKYRAINYARRSVRNRGIFLLLNPTYVRDA